MVFNIQATNNGAASQAACDDFREDDVTTHRTGPAKRRGGVSAEVYTEEDAACYIKKVKQEAHQLVGQAKRSAAKIRPKAIRGDIFDFSINADRKQLVTSYTVWLQTRPVWMSM